MNKTPDFRPPSGDGSFRTTRWSMVAAASDRGNPQAQDALAFLAQAYWYPLYASLRRKGIEANEARDLTQGFFARLLERHDLENLAPENGRFRAYLLASLKHFFLNEKEKAGALKRGGDAVVLSIDALTADGLYALEPADGLTPERQFERSWAQSVLDRVLESVERSYREQGKGELFDQLQGHLTGSVETASHREIGEVLGMSEGAVKVAAHRLRRRFGEKLREEIAQTLSDPSELDDELRHLMECLSTS